MSFFTLFLSVGAVSAISGAILLVYLHLYYIDIPTIPGIPEIPDGEFLAGHFHQLGKDHATTTEQWSRKYNWPVFQMRMGRRRAIVLNSFQSARDWLVKNQSATLDRPWFHTFHGVVSATSAPTIGTSPWDERTKKQRRVVGSFTTGPSIQRMKNLLDLEVGAMVSAMFYDAEKSGGEIMPHVYQKRLALNLMMMFCYGTRFDSVHNPLMHQILKDASTIASFRSTFSTAQDFIPHLRWFSRSSSTKTAMEVRARRDKWLAQLLNQVRSTILSRRVGSKKCVAEMLITDNEENLSEMDVKTILGGLMSGGFETIFSTLIITIGQLSTKSGQSIQQKAFEEIMSLYETPEQAYEAAIVEEKSPYICALVKEALRFYPPLKLLPARQTYKAFEYEGALIPKGVLLYVNTQAISQDKEAYGPDADQFNPSRWLTKEKEKETAAIPPPYHFAFGAGARMCTAVNMSNRVLYAAFVRLILSFKITESKTMPPPNTDYIDYKRDPTASNAIASEFKVRLEPRDRGVLETCFEESGERVRGSEWADCAEALRK